MCTYKPQPTRGPFFIPQMVPRKSKKFHASNSKPWKITRKGPRDFPTTFAKEWVFPYHLCFVCDKKTFGLQMRLDFFCAWRKTFPIGKKKALRRSYLDVSGNSGFPPKSSILIGFSITFTIHFGGPPLFLENTHLASLSRNGLMASSLEPPPNLASEDLGSYMSSRNFCAWWVVCLAISHKKSVWNHHISPPKAPCDPESSKIFK